MSFFSSISVRVPDSCVAVYNGKQAEYIVFLFIKAKGRTSGQQMYAFGNDFMKS